MIYPVLRKIWFAIYITLLTKEFQIKTWLFLSGSSSVSKFMAVSTAYGCMCDMALLGRFNEDGI